MSTVDFSWTFSQKSFKKARLLIIVAVVLFVAGYSWYAWTSSTERQTREYDQTILAGRKDVRILNAEAVAKLEQAVQNAPSPSEEALSKIDLGGAYFLFSPDRFKGLDLLKEVAANTRYAGAMRARAVLKILYAFIIGRMDLRIANENIFTGSDFWSNFTKGSADPEETTRKAYEWTLQYGEWISAKYYIASWYGMRLLEAKINKTPLDQATEKEYREKFAFYMEDGDKWIPNLLASSRNESYEKAGIFGKHADIHALAYMLNGTADDRAEAERSFKQTLSMTDSFGEQYSEIYADSTRRIVQFDYAKLLAYDAVVNNRKDFEPRIHELLVPIMKVTDERVSIRTLLRNTGLLKGTHALRWQTENIAEADSEFALFLKEMGWIF